MDLFCEGREPRASCMLSMLLSFTPTLALSSPIFTLRLFSRARLFLEVNPLFLSVPDLEGDWFCRLVQLFCFDFVNQWAPPRPPS